MATFREYTDWLFQARGAPYEWWLSGPVSLTDGPPAWAVNAPVPDISEIDRGFCVAVYNLACRWFGLLIPPSQWGEGYDGGVVSTWEYWYSSSVWYSERKAAGFQDGDLLISPYNGTSSQGHVAMICHYNGVPYVLEWIVNGGLVWNYTPDESNNWGNYQVCLPVEVWGRGKVDSGTSEPPPAKPPTEYPGDCADPKPLAHWMAHVAESEFALPKELPVMTVAVEMTSALTQPGCLQDIPGYLSAQDHDSVGLLQQRPSMGWGTYEQCIDAHYAVRKFCEVAASMKDYEWHANTTDPDALGRWCQAVQRSGVPDAYRDKGYPIARDLLADYDVPAPPTPPPEGETMHLAKYTFLGSGQGPVDFCNVAVTVLESYAIDAMAYNGDAAIEQAGQEARADHNVVVVGQQAFTRLGESQTRAGWEKDDVVWWTAQPDDAAALKFVIDWVLWWIGNHSDDKLDAKLDLDYIQILQALPKGEKYLQLLQGDPIAPPPQPTLTLEQRVERLEKKVFGEEDK